MQIKKYIDWLQHRFQCFNSNAYQPIVIGAMIDRNHSLRKLQYRVDEFINFNNLTISLPIIYIEYIVNIQNNTINFYQYDYIQNTRSLLWSI